MRYPGDVSLATRSYEHTRLVRVSKNRSNKSNSNKANNKLFLKTLLYQNLAYANNPASKHARLGDCKAFNYSTSLFNSKKQLMGEGNSGCAQSENSIDAVGLAGLVSMFLHAVPAIIPLCSSLSVRLFLQTTKSIYSKAEFLVKLNFRSMSCSVVANIYLLEDYHCVTQYPYGVWF